MIRDDLSEPLHLRLARESGTTPLMAWCALSPIYRYRVPKPEIARIRSAHRRLFGAELPGDGPYRPNPEGRPTARDKSAKRCS